MMTMWMSLICLVILALPSIITSGAVKQHTSVIAKTNTTAEVHNEDKCAIHEKYVKCPAKLCRPQICEEVGIPQCTSHEEKYYHERETEFNYEAGVDETCPSPPACVCIDNYVRDDDGVCISAKDCPSCGNDKNATSGCGVNCGRRCSNYDSKEPIVCAEICYVNGCDCKKGYVFDDYTGWCVLPKDCSNKNPPEPTGTDGTTTSTGGGDTTTGGPCDDCSAKNCDKQNVTDVKNGGEMTCTTEAITAEMSSTTHTRQKKSTPYTTTKQIESSTSEKEKHLDGCSCKGKNRTTSATTKEPEPATSKSAKEAEATTEKSETTLPTRKRKRSLLTMTTIKEPEPTPTDTTIDGKETETTKESTGQETTNTELGKPTETTTEYETTKITEKSTEPKITTTESSKPSETTEETQITVKSTEPETTTTESGKPSETTTESEKTKMTEKSTARETTITELDKQSETTTECEETKMTETSTVPETTTTNSGKLSETTTKREETNMTEKSTKPETTTTVSSEPTETTSECKETEMTEESKEPKTTEECPEPKITTTESSEPTETTSECEETEMTEEFTEPETTEECTKPEMTTTESSELTETTSQCEETETTEESTEPEMTDECTEPEMTTTESSEPTETTNECETETTEESTEPEMTTTESVEETTGTPESTPTTSTKGPQDCKGKNEWYYKCAPSCAQPTCSEYLKGIRCLWNYSIKICKPECRCLVGYYTDSDGKCVSAFECRKLAMSTSTTKSSESTGDTTITTKSPEPICEEGAYELYFKGNLAFTATILNGMYKMDSKNNLMCAGSSILHLMSQLALSSGPHKEILTALNLNNTEQIRCQFPALYKNLTANYEGIDFKIFCKIYADDKCKLTKKYKKKVTDIFTFGPENLDFSDPGSAKHISNEVFQTTKSFPNYINTEELSSLSSLILVDAQNFQGRWEKQFDPEDTLTMNFFSWGKIEKKSFIYQKNKFLYGDSFSLGAKILKLEFEGGDFTFVVFLPFFFGGLKDVLRKLTNADLVNTELLKLREEHVEVYMPKFNITVAEKLKVFVESANIVSIFTSNTNDLKDVATCDRPYVSEILQKLTFHVDEYGMGDSLSLEFPKTVTTAPSGFHFTRLFKADQPFAFFLNYHRIVLFAGVYAR